MSAQKVNPIATGMFYSLKSCSRMLEDNWQRNSHSAQTINTRRWLEENLLPAKCDNALGFNRRIVCIV